MAQFRLILAPDRDDGLEHGHRRSQVSSAQMGVAGS